jgi:3-hydroxyisobutyrate dehydrogenase-like beta-hydroxyacid dehydrogenase
MSDIGFVGLGRMGLPILKQISSKFKVKMAYNRTKEKASGLEGIRIANEPFQVSSSCDIVFVMLSDDKATAS